MPISKRFSSYTKENVNLETDNFGVYELANENNEVIYIGEGQVKTRLMAHFPTGQHPIKGATKYRVEYTGSKLRCEQRERALLKEFEKANGRLPRWNKQLGGV